MICTWSVKVESLLNTRIHRSPVSVIGFLEMLLDCSAVLILLLLLKLLVFLKAMARKVSQKVITVESTVYDSLKMATTCT